LLEFDRRIDRAFLGYPMQAFILTRLKQRLLAEVSAALADIPEVVEVHGLSGDADLLVQVVGRDAYDLYRGRADPGACRRCTRCVAVRRSAASARPISAQGADEDHPMVLLVEAQEADRRVLVHHPRAE
jgi:DNA-binding Lrp family transcriptional regulator